MSMHNGIESIILFSLYGHISIVTATITKLRLAERTLSTVWNQVTQHVQQEMCPSIVGCAAVDTEQKTFPVIY